MWRSKPLDLAIALVLILWGLWVIVSAWQSIWTLLRYGSLGFFFDVSILLFGACLPLVAVASGIGLLRGKKWAWRPARTLSLIAFVVYVMSIINFTIARYFWWNIPPPPIPEDADVTYYSSAAIGALVSGVLTIVIARRSEQVLRAEEPPSDKAGRPKSNWNCIYQDHPTSYCSWRPSTAWPVPGLEEILHRLQQLLIPEKR
jgi:peptidoglycan/LPS O-acetylase OafA/YrhL